MIIDLINTVANAVIVIFCVWAVLDRRVHTRLVGTALLAIVGVCAALNIARTDFEWFLPANYAVALNVALAGLAIWFWVTWHDPRRRERRGIPR